ncbi:hypothetical protein OCS_05982 [Ophiocordyceps sinensis CO18]|uniref:Uncharacterized protein n=1 Tax=Ophiocordyceps sinensis (strain Co18 / CGMCC 3.14243) TaxID=911162 RepID=T5A6T0_OPHSC|nr:hypothetical protein OCS_05982 [Ophiocordyceps sinensis CO18]
MLLDQVLIASPARYPKHVWSPSGGWYAQPANWRANTLIAGVVVAGALAVTWKFSAERETWTRKPEPGEWFPSRQYVAETLGIVNVWDKHGNGADADGVRTAGRGNWLTGTRRIG